MIMSRRRQHMHNGYTARPSARTYSDDVRPRQRFNSHSCALLLQDTRNLAQLPPPDPRFDTSRMGMGMQAEQRGGAADSHLRGGADGAYYPGQPGLGQVIIAEAAACYFLVSSIEGVGGLARRWPSCLFVLSVGAHNVYSDRY